jgi:hypothetical protein
VTLVGGCFESHPLGLEPRADAGAPAVAVFDARVDTAAPDAGSVREPDAGQRPDTGVDAGAPVQPCIEGSDRVIEGDHWVTTQAQVMELTGIREVRGALKFNRLALEATAALPAALGCLERVEGELAFDRLQGPLTLTSLARLQHVGGVRIIYCAGLHDLAGLEFLTEVAGDLWLEENSALTSLDALRNLSHVAGELFVGRSPLTSLHGLDSLTAVEGSVSLYYDEGLTDLRGLGSLVRIGGHLLIWSQIELTSLAGLESLQSVGGDLAISGNPSLQDLSGLDTLTTVGGGFGIYNNALLSRCHGERLARQLGRPCGWPGMECEGLCTCIGNLNDVTCAPDPGF